SLEAFRALGATRLLRHVSPEIPSALPHELQESLAALDAYRRRFDSVPEALTNPVLLGSLIVPLGLMRQRPRRRHDDEEPTVRSLPRLGQLPVARKDVERLAHVLMLQGRLLDTDAPPRRQHGVIRRPSFADALTWMEIHGQSPDVVAYWRALAEEAGHPGRRRHPQGQGRGPEVVRPGADSQAGKAPQPTTDEAGGVPPVKRRRRRRRRRGPGTE
ncbi:MAG: hypothetical protein MUF60_09990, partial [Vicinamibacterales bacterium]|nr:hypothetical protein [Vicinamibacterales bacterium]